MNQIPCSSLMQLNMNLSKKKYNLSYPLIIWLLCCSLFIFSAYSFTIDLECSDALPIELVKDKTELKCKSFQEFSIQSSIQKPSYSASKFYNHELSWEDEIRKTKIIVQLQRVVFDHFKSVHFKASILWARLQSQPDFFLHLI